MISDKQLKELVELHKKSVKQAQEENIDGNTNFHYLHGKYKGIEEVAEILGVWLD